MNHAWLFAQGDGNKSGGFLPGGVIGGAIIGGIAGGAVAVVVVIFRAIVGTKKDDDKPSDSDARKGDSP
jgi:hypothetical protein